MGGRGFSAGALSDAPRGRKSGVWRGFARFADGLENAGTPRLRRARQDGQHQGQQNGCSRRFGHGSSGEAAAPGHGKLRSAADCKALL